MSSIDQRRSLQPQLLPNRPCFVGCSFALATSSPPLLSDHVIKGRLVWYREQIASTSNSLDYFKSVNTPYHFDRFHDIRRDDSGQEYKVSCTREQFTMAWIAGINGHRFHAELLFSAKTAEEPEVVSRYRQLKTDLVKAAKQWSMLYEQVDLAMNLLEQYENSRIVPYYWSYQWPYDITDLEMGDLLNPGCAKEKLTSLFIYAAHHLLKISPQGYRNDFLEFADMLGCPSPDICRLPGLSSYDDVQEDPPELWLDGARSVAEKAPEVLAIRRRHAFR
ncbi:uncharacterized protein IL334_005942 [Kwoniella shivajii]|uniref:Uncharacterized protein n=1 Tax=Kwoniella shivajii TaxID=564305 RepID=A0ABZ1D6E1_9TREE|nr:hypothetical protein IL334_005942 [Kwoniella shivajii]